MRRGGTGYTCRVALTNDLLTLLRGAAPCFVATLMPDGSPQLTQTWVDTDGEHVVINTVEGFQKVRNLRRDPRVSINVCDPTTSAATSRSAATSWTSRPRAAGSTSSCSSQRYTGGPYRNYGGRPSTRLIVTIAVDKVRSPF